MSLNSSGQLKKLVIKNLLRFMSDSNEINFDLLRNSIQELFNLVDELIDKHENSI